MSVLRFKPSPFRVVVKKTDSLLERKTIIVKPQTAEENCAVVGIVMANGVEDSDGPRFPLNPGDVVLFHMHEALEFELDGESFYILPHTGVLGVIAV